MIFLVIIFVTFLFFDLFYTRYILGKMSKKDKKWYKNEKGLAQSFFYRKFGLNKGFIVIFIIDLIIASGFIYVSLIMNLEIENLLKPRVLYTMGLVFLITLYLTTIHHNTLQFKFMKRGEH